MSSVEMDAIVIGAGANGLVAATALAKAGARVQVVESESSVGGTWRPISVAPGFESPLELEADWVPPAVAGLLGLTAADFGPAPSSSVLLDDGSVLTLPSDVAAAAAAITRYSPKDATRWPAFTSMLRDLSAFLEVMYQQAAPDLDAKSVRDVPSLLTLGRSFRSLGKANMSELLRVLPLPVRDLADDWLTFEPLKAAIAAAGVREIRQGPRSGGTSFVLLHYLTGAHAGGYRGRRPLRGGPGAFIAAAESAARKAGVSIRTGARVAMIDVRDDAVRGVMLNRGEMLASKTVISTADPRSTLLGMIDPVWLDPELLRAAGNIRYRGCTAFVCFALDRPPEDPALSGVVSLSSTTNAIERPFDASKYGEASAMPHIELTLNGRVLLARVEYIPYALRDGVWDAARRGALGDLVAAAIDRAMPGVLGSLRERAVLTPVELAERFGVTEGAFTHGEMGLDQILFMRPIAGWGRHSTPIKGLYLGSAGTHPGPGIAGGPGWLASRRVMSDWRKKR